MLNSASLERQDALDLAREHDCRVVVTAAGERGMPNGAGRAGGERVAHGGGGARQGLRAGRSLRRPAGLPHLGRFPTFGHHCFDAIRALRERFGSEIHITGGMSNVSFGLPARKILNDMFVLLAVEAGADCGIMDPVASPPEAIFAVDRADPNYKLAEDVLLGPRRALHGLHPRLAEKQAQSQVKKGPP